MAKPLWKAAWHFFKELSIELSYDPAILILSIYIPRRTGNTCPHKMFIAALFLIAAIFISK